MGGNGEGEPLRWRPAFFTAHPSHLCVMGTGHGTARHSPGSGGLQLRRFLTNQRRCIDIHIELAQSPVSPYRPIHIVTQAFDRVTIAGRPVVDS